MYRQYSCSYWTTQGRLIKMVVTAESNLAAQEHIFTIPDFRNFCAYPQVIIEK